MAVMSMLTHAKKCNAKWKKKIERLMLGSLLIFCAALFPVRTQNSIIGDVLWL
jgi:hypothetical protein